MKYAYFVFLSLVAAVGNMGVVYTINRIVNDYFSNKHVLSGIYLLYFLGSLVLFIVCRWLVSLGIIKFTQKLLHSARLEVLRMILRSSFGNLVKNKNRVYTALTRDTDNIVGASINIVDILTNSIVVIICFVYMGTLSWKLLLCMMGLLTFTLLIYFLSVKRAEKLFRQAMEHNDKFVKYLNEILSGFKEISLSPPKGHEIANKHIDKAINAASVYNQKAHITFLNNRIIGQIAFYIFIGLVMLFLGQLFGIPKSVLVNFIFLVLYIWSPIETVVLLIPALSQARTSLKRLDNLESQVNETNPVSDEPLQVLPFSSVSLKNIAYQYPSEDEKNKEAGFGIGPVSLTIREGEVIFISGGNGSGKTTLINILLGLIKAGEGEIYLNDNLVQHTQLKDYKTLFAPVFSDFHLFDEFYGNPGIDLAKAAEYLELFEIDDKVNVDQGKFSDINVSTGQRKRLALINAMLEKKPILVLDEFAADQDPHFKRKFYREIIPRIKSEGFTLVAITHDDNYYQYAGKLYKMDSGELHEMPIKHTPVVDLI